MNENHRMLKAVAILSDRLSGRDSIAEALEVLNSDTAGALRLMEENRIVPQVGKNLGRNGMLGELSEKMRTVFEKARVETAAYNILLMDTAKKILNEATAAGIGVVSLKGVSLLDRLYAPDERGLSDIDLLVRKDDAGRLAELLTDMGFHRIEGGLSPAFEYVFSGEWKFGMDRGGSFVVAEAHWNINPGRALEKIYPLDARRLLESVEIKNGFPTLKPEVEIAYLLHHLAVRHSFCRFMWLLDVRYSLRADGVDIDALKMEIKQAGLERAAWLLVWLMRELLDDQKLEQITDWKPNAIEKFALTSFVLNSLSGGVMKTSGLLPGLISDDPAKYYFYWMFPGEEFLKDRYPGVPRPLRQAYRAGDIAAKVFRRVK